MSNDADTARAAGRGFLVITGAKLWFMVGGALIGLGLPYLVGAAGYGKYTDVNNSLGLFVAALDGTSVTRLLIEGYANDIDTINTGNYLFSVATPKIVPR